MSSEGFRGGYKPFYDAVKELAARGVFDASEVSDLGSEFESKDTDEFTALFPRNGVYRGCRTARIKDKLYSVHYESDIGQFLEKLELTSSSLKLPAGALITLNMKDFTYESYADEGTIQKLRFKGKFRRPEVTEKLYSEKADSGDHRTKARKVHCDEADSSAEGEDLQASDNPACESCSGERDQDNLDRRQVQSTETQEFKPRHMPSNFNREPKGSAGLPKASDTDGRGRLGDIRYRDDWHSNIRKQRFQSGKSGGKSRLFGPKSRHEGDDVE